MADYRFYFADALTDAVLGELPAISCSYSEGLNTEGKFGATLPLKVLDSNGVPLYDMNDLVPGKVAVYIERDGVIVWGGMIWSAEADFGSDQLTLDGADFLSLFRRRYVRRTIGFNQVTGPRIAAALIEYAEVEGGNADYGLDIGGAIAAGIGRDRTYYDYERKEIGSAIIDLANLRGGFDFLFTAARIDGKITKRFTTYYPSTGRQTSITLALGTNIEGLKVKMDSTALASRVDAAGGGEAEAKLYGTYVEVVPYPLFEDVMSMGDEHTQANLVDHAARRVARGRAPLIAATVAVRGDDPPIGSYIPGDIVQLTAKHGWVDINAPVRITSIDVKVDDTGHDTVELNCVSLNAFDEFGH